MFFIFNLKLDIWTTIKVKTILCVIGFWPILKEQSRLLHVFWFLTPILSAFCTISNHTAGIPNLLSGMHLSHSRYRGENAKVNNFIMEIRNKNHALTFCTPKTSFETLINPKTKEGVESFKIATSVSQSSPQFWQWFVLFDLP